MKEMPVPRGACDCHAHVFGPADRFDFIANRDYTPPERPAGDYRAMLASLGIERGVIVQPSVYGTDNSATLSAIAELGQSFRGIAVVASDVDDATLAGYDAGGIRGVRLNEFTKGGVSLAFLEAMAARLEGSGWHIQVIAKVAGDPAIIRRLGKLGVPVVIDHFGLLDPERGVGDPGFQAMLSLVRDGNAWMKLSGAYISSRREIPYDDMKPYADALVAAAPERLVWGSDWPHPVLGDKTVDDRALLALLEAWAPDEPTRKRILVDNPAALYGFPAP
jgi:predicted TIM-barrel fold metal-dependent hydrolase